MNRLFYGVVSIVVCLSACSSDDNEPINGADNVGSHDSRFVSLGEAIEIANDYISQIDGTTTKSVKRIVSSVELLNGRKTRGNSDNSDYNDYYLINYSDDKGFAIVSSDKYKIPVYAFSDEGSLSWSDTTYNEGFRQYVRGLNNTANFLVPDSLINPPKPDDVIDYKVNVNIIVDPFIRKVVAQVGQYSPYNLYCPVDSLGEHYPVGCGPVSLLTVCSYYSKPNSINDYSINWKEINSTAESQQAARFLFEIGKDNYLKVTYSMSGTGIKGKDIENTLSALNYSYVVSSGYHEMGVLNSLSNLMPVIILGARKVTENVISAHSWVSDGYLETETIYFPNTMSPSIIYHNYLHMLWGNYGRGNGYFLYDNGFGGTPSYYDYGEESYETTRYDYYTYTINNIKYKN